MPQNEKDVRSARCRSRSFVGRNCSSVANSSVHTSYPQLLHSRNQLRLSPVVAPAITNSFTENAFGLHSSPGRRHRKFLVGSGILAQNFQTLVTRPWPAALVARNGRSNSSHQASPALGADAARFRRLLGAKILRRIGAHHDSVRPRALSA